MNAQPARPEMFQKLRRQLFTGQLRSDSGAGAEVHGVAMEACVDGGSYLVFGLADGSASVYLSTGGGWIGGQGRPHINAAARRLVEVARPWARKFPLTKDHPIPRAGRVRFSIFTPEGVRAAEADEAELNEQRGALVPIFAAAQEIITGFRLMDSREEPRDEMSYVNCLLTALARGHGRPARLAEGRPPPDPATLTRDAEDLEWIAGIGFELGDLDTGKIVRTLLDMAGFRWYRFGMSEGHIEVALATEGGGQVPVAFRVQRRRRSDGHAEIEVAPERTSA